MNLVSRDIFRITIALVMFTSCDGVGDNCIRSSGDESNKDIALEKFKALVVKDQFDVELIQDSLDFAELIYGENLIEGVKFQIEGETLTIENDNICNWTRLKTGKPKVKLHFTSLSHLETRNSGEITCENLIADTLLIETTDASGNANIHLECKHLELYQHSGLTDFRLSGNCNSAILYHSSRSPLDASSLSVEALEINQNGYGDIHAFAKEVVFYQIQDAGDIYFSGPAKVVKWEVNGGGQFFLE